MTLKNNTMSSYYFKNTNIYIILLSLIAFTIPLPMLANNIAIILLIVYWLTCCFKKKIYPLNLKSVFILTIPYLLLIIGATYTLNNEQLITELIKSLPFLILPIVIYSISQKISIYEFKTILKSFVIGNIVVCLFLLSVIFKTIYLKSFSVETLWGLTHQNLGELVDMNAIYLALYIGLSLLIVVYYYLKKTKKFKIKSNLLYLSTILLFILLLIFLSSRTVLFSLMLIMIILFYQHYVKRDNIVKSALLSILIGGFTLITIFSINPVLKWRVASLFEIQDSGQIQGKEEGIKMRKKLWASSFEVINDNWLLGVGTGDFKDELEKVYHKNKYRIQYRKHMNSHNQYISYLVSNGIIGLLLFFLYLFYPLIIYYKKRRLLLWMIILLFSMCFVTESYFYTNKGVILTAFFMTLMFKHSEDLVEE